MAIELIPEWLPHGQQNIGKALNDAAAAWAAGQLLSVSIVAETTNGGYTYWMTEPENLVSVLGFFFSLANYLSHDVPFGGSDEDDPEGAEA